MENIKYIKEYGALSKADKKKIKSMKKAKDFEGIYREYGSSIYLHLATHKYLHQDLKRLKKDGRYEDINNKYGEKEYEKTLMSAKFRDVYTETGSRIKAYHKSYGIKHRRRLALLVLSLGIFAKLADYELGANRSFEYVANIERLNQYEAQVREDLSSYDFDNMDDLEIVVTLVNDMWNRIDGYKTPDTGDEVLSLSRLYLYEHNYGICRNMSDDLAYRLNAINPAYNARNICVKCNGNGWTAADYDIKILEGLNNTTVSQTGDEANIYVDNRNLLDKMSDQVFPDHAVTVFDLQDYNITLVVDPTNGGIGMFKNGRIEMFNANTSDNKEAVRLDYRGLFNFLFYGLDETVENSKDFLGSYFTGSYSKYNSIYGLDSQNRVLDEINDVDSFTRK